ncbi:MAG: hypothetical protein M3Q56_05500 [Bacteroidota bacterium]|nr:hypothetical protein [Bacteroidota bacterium]
MKDKYDRIAPIIICLTFYLWLWINLKQNENVSRIFIAFILSSIVSMILSFIINQWLKLSLHTVSMGAFISFWILIRQQYSAEGILNFRFLSEQTSGFHLHHLIGISFILAGAIGTSRLILQTHTLKEVLLGYAVGILSTIFAFSFTLD